MKWLMAAIIALSYLVLLGELDQQDNRITSIKDASK